MARNNSGGALNAVRDESGKVTVIMSTQEKSFGEVPEEICAKIDVGCKRKQRS